MTRREDPCPSRQSFGQVARRLPCSGDKPADRGVRRHVEGAIIASELAAAEAHPTPAAEPDEAQPASCGVSLSTIRRRFRVGIAMRVPDGSAVAPGVGATPAPLCVCSFGTYRSGVRDPCAIVRVAAVKTGHRVSSRVKQTCR